MKVRLRVTTFELTFHVGVWHCGGRKCFRMNNSRPWRRHLRHAPLVQGQALQPVQVEPSANLTHSTTQPTSIDRPSRSTEPTPPPSSHKRRVGAAQRDWLIAVQRRDFFSPIYDLTRTCGWMDGPLFVRPWHKRVGLLLDYGNLYTQGRRRRVWVNVMVFGGMCSLSAFRGTQRAQK